MRSLLVLFIISLVFTPPTKAQSLLLNPVKWKFSIKHTDKAEQYVVTAKAKIEPGWHVFDLHAGGDGFLIPTEFSFEDSDTKVLKTTAKGDLIIKEFAGIDGKVRFYEKEVSFAILIRSKKDMVKGSVYHQVCDDEMCLPPKEENFTLKIK